MTRLPYEKPLLIDLQNNSSLIGYGVPSSGSGCSGGDGDSTFCQGGNGNAGGAGCGGGGQNSSGDCGGGGGVTP